MTAPTAKLLGRYYTPAGVAQSLVRWAVRRASDRLLDPSCGDGQFLRLHDRAVGVDISAESCAAAKANAPGAVVHEADFFAWAEQTEQRFDCVVGNPPFIRYQRFSGEARRRALRLARQAGAHLSSLTSSWAPFLAASSALLSPGGRMAFVVPAELGHAPYAVPLLEALCSSFERVRVIAIREKIFPELSEDAWLLLASGYGQRATAIALTIWERFRPFRRAPRPTKQVLLSAWRSHGCRLRKFLLPDAVLDYYEGLCHSEGCSRLGEIARVGIGYVTGANDFFHLRPSEAEARGVPEHCLTPTIRKGDQLPDGAVKPSDVALWLASDLPILLLSLAGKRTLPESVRAYLNSPAGQKARQTYKCRNRSPWYVVPDVSVPDAFISYMSGIRPPLARNLAGCTCTNSIHAVHFDMGAPRDAVFEAWDHPLSDLSREIEGHPLGGGMLKLEP
ncbi:MAG: Eco57I restriction-modification methylase domain-containing protein, partial [Planctomycetota bacterium]